MFATQQLDTSHQHHYTILTQQVADNPLLSLILDHSLAMTPRSSGSTSRTYHEEGPHSLQLLPRGIPITPQPATHSSHHRSRSLSHYPRFEESLVDEKPRSNGVVRTSFTKSDASTPWAAAHEPLSLRHQSRSSEASSLRHLTSNHCSASLDLPPSPIPHTTRSHVALPLPSLHTGYLHPPRKIRLCSIIKPWLPVLAYLSTSLGFVVAVAFWKTQVFQGAFYTPIFPPYPLSPFIPSLGGNWGHVMRLRLSVSIQDWTTCLAGSRPTKLLAVAFSFSSFS